MQPHTRSPGAPFRGANARWSLDVSESHREHSASVRYVESPSLLRVQFGGPPTYLAESETCKVRSKADPERSGQVK